MAKLPIKLIIFFIVFGFSLAPLIMPLVGMGNTTLVDYSIYNRNWNGLSTFRSMVEQNGYEVKPIISSISSVNRVNRESILLIVGPSMFYDSLSSLAIIDYLNNGSNVIIADDFGSSSSLLLFLASIIPGIGICEGHLLLDAGSYDKNVSLPLITFLSSHPIFSGVNSLLFNYATVIAGTGFSALAYSSSSSWLDVDADYAYDTGEQIGPFPVIASASYGNGSIILISDPSIFNNDMINRADNSRFCMNLISWATGGDTSILIIFDEGHRSDLSTSVFFFGVILGEINWVSSNWLLAPIYPIFAIYIIRSWLPKKQVQVKTEAAKTSPKSSFSSKLDWYNISQNYNKAIDILVKKLKKDIISFYHLKYFDLHELAEKLAMNNTSLNKKDIISFFDTLDILIKGDKIVADKELFLRVFVDINRFREMVGLKW